MKKLLFFFLLFPTITFGQLYVGGKNLNDENLEYIELGGYNYGLYFRTFVDYGQKTADNAFIIQDNKGNAVSFKTSIEAINFVAERGWELVSTQVTKRLVYVHVNPDEKKEVEYFIYIMKKK